MIRITASQERHQTAYIGRVSTDHQIRQSHQVNRRNHLNCMQTSLVKGFALEVRLRIMDDARE